MLNSNRLVTGNQWAYRKGYSTELLLVHLTETWRHAIDTGYVVGVAFIDFKKAFDCIDHRGDPAKKASISFWNTRLLIKLKFILSNELIKLIKVDNQPGTFKCTRTRCKTCPFISNMVKISGPNRCAKITDHFTCISANVIYCITCTLCKKIYIGETGRRLADRFREHLRDVEKNDTHASKPVARHFNLPNHSHHNMTICGLSLHHGNTESRKNLEQKFIFQLGTLYPHGINERLSFH